MPAPSADQLSFVTAAPLVHVVQDTTSRRDYTLEGAVVGGTVTGVLGAAIMIGFCGYDSRDSTASCVGRAVLGAVFAAVPGVVIGGILGSTIEKP